MLCLVSIDAILEFQVYGRHHAFSVKELLGKLQASDDVPCIIPCLPDHKDNTWALQLVVIEGRERIADVDTLAWLGSIDLKRVLKESREAKLLGQLNTKHTVFEYVGMKAEGAVAVKDVLDVSLFREVVVNAFDSHDLLPAVLHHECLPFEDRRIDFHHIALLELQQGSILRTDGLPVGRSDTQLCVESSKEVCHEVLKAVEYAQRDHHRHRCHRHAKY